MSRKYFNLKRDLLRNINVNIFISLQRLLFNKIKTISKIKERYLISYLTDEKEYFSEIYNISVYF